MLDKFDYYVEEHDYEFVVFVEGYSGLVAFPTEKQANEFVSSGAADAAMERRASYPDYGF